MLPERVRAEQQPVVGVGDGDDDGGVGAREVLEAGVGVDPHPAGLRRDVAVAGARREGGRLVPVRERQRLGEQPGIPILKPPPQGPQVAPRAGQLIRHLVIDDERHDRGPDHEVGGVDGVAAQEDRQHVGTHPLRLDEGESPDSASSARPWWSTIARASGAASRASMPSERER